MMRFGYVTVVHEQVIETYIPLESFIVFSRNQYRRLLPAMCHNLRDGGRGPRSTGDCVYNTWPVAALTHAVKPDMGSESRFLLYPTCIRRPRWRGSRRNIAMPCSMEKLEWRGYPMVKKFLMICLFFLTQLTNVTVRQTHTDRQTDTAWWHRPRLYIASRGKNGSWGAKHAIDVGCP